MNKFYLNNVCQERLLSRQSPRLGKITQVDRLLLHHHRSHLRPHSFHNRLRLFQSKYPRQYPDNFYQVNYPSESSGKLCYLDLPNQPFVFFRYPTDTTR